MHYYILKGTKPVETDSETWSVWFANTSRHINLTEIDGIEISTVFLGLDHGYNSKKPMLFETMIFGLPNYEEYCTRCSTWQEAEEMHKKAIDWVNNGCKDDEK